MNPPPSDAAIRALAAEILRRSEYAQWRTSEWMVHALQWFARLGHDRPPLYWGLFVTLVVVALVLLAHVTIAIRAVLKAPPRRDPEHADASLPSFVADAETLAAAGRYLEATRSLQLAVIEVLLRRRVVTLTRSDPNRTLRARLREAALPAGERGELIALIDRFERCWFRDGAGDRDLYEAWRRAHDRLATLRAA
jgi:hypothetical protein